MSEIDMKEAIIGRLQVSSAMIFAFTGVIIYLVRNLNMSYVPAFYWFSFFIVLLITLISLSVYNFIRAWWGHIYKMVPSLRELEDYRKDLITTCKSSDSEEIYDEKLIEYFADCAGKNADVNDNRAILLHRCNSFLISSIFPLIISLVIFNFSNLDKSAIPETQNIRIINDQHINDKPILRKTMNSKDEEKKPPTPPPPRERRDAEEIPLKKS